MTDEIKDLVERLGPRWVIDEPVGLAVSILSHGNAELSDALTSFLVSNNALKKEAADALSRIAAERDEARRALEKIDAVRNSIIGFQSINWSEHIYPLVAALEEAGYGGAGYPASRANAGTLLEQIKAAEAERDRLTAMVERAFRDGIAYASLTVVTDPDEAWRTSSIREALSSIKGKGSGVVE